MNGNKQPREVSLKSCSHTDLPGVEWQSLHVNHVRTYELSLDSSEHCPGLKSIPHNLTSMALQYINTSGNRAFLDQHNVSSHLPADCVFNSTHSFGGLYCTACTLPNSHLCHTQTTRLLMNRLHDARAGTSLQQHIFFMHHTSTCCFGVSSTCNICYTGSPPSATQVDCTHPPKITHE